MAMHRAIPTSIKPSRRPLSSGRKAHASANCVGRQLQMGNIVDEPTMKRGAMIQLMTRLKAIWIQRAFSRNDRCKVSYLTLHKIGYIMTSRPIAYNKSVRLSLNCGKE
jgi:hypothetical protein